MFEQLDIPMARKVLEFLQIEHEDFKHDQGPYYSKSMDGFCGTSACVAGTAVMLCPEAEIVSLLKESEEDFEVDLRGVRTGWREAGRDILGLTDKQSDSLFYCAYEDLALERLGHWIEIAEQEQAEA